MTKRQIRVCKAIKKHRTLGKILRKSKIADSDELQDIVYPHYLDFSDDRLDDETEVELQNEAIEELESYQARMIDTWITRGIAICALLISLASLFRP